MNKKQIIIGMILIILLAILFYSTLPIISPDSSLYYNLSNIVNRQTSFSYWNEVRGFTLPVLIAIITTLFGNNILGINTGLLLSYLLLIFVNLKILSITLTKSNKSVKIISYTTFILFFTLNPLIIGYSHTLLTEAFAPLFISLVILFSWLFIYSDSKKTGIYYISIILLNILMWFLKEPYFPICFISVIISTIFVIIRKPKSKHEKIKVTLPILTLVCLIFSIFIWQNILEKKHVSDESKNQSFLATSILDGLTNFRHINENINEEYINKNKHLSNSDKQKLINILKDNDKKYKNFILLEKLNIKGDTIGNEYLLLTNQTPNLNDVLVFLKRMSIENPLLVIDSYASNYLATINVFKAKHIGHRHYHPVKTFEESFTENKSLGLVTFEERPIYWWAWSNDIAKDRPYNSMHLEKINKPHKLIVKIAEAINPIFLLSFKLIFLSVPFLSIYYFVRTVYLRKNKKIIEHKIRILELLSIIFISSFGHVVFHAMMGAIIDRYAYVAYPVTITGLIAILSLHTKVNEKTKTKTKNMSQKYDKILVTIPAYNEEKNISKVIDELRKDFKQADILVINDCSTDNTPNILKDKNVTFVTPPFNMKYSGAVQTGIRYAKEHNYNCVIQFDGDGQHVAKEAKKLLDKMKKSNCDLVIGSRFIQKTDYKHPFFRKVGTVFYSSIIKVFTDRVITDPTSGMQCLNNKIIDYYSKLGVYPEFPDANLITDLILKGYYIEEVSVEMRLNEQGVSMHSGIIKPIKYMIIVTYSIFLIVIKNIELEWKYYE